MCWLMPSSTYEDADETACGTGALARRAAGRDEREGLQGRGVRTRPSGGLTARVGRAVGSENDLPKNRPRVSVNYWAQNATFRSAGLAGLLRGGASIDAPAVVDLAAG